MKEIIKKIILNNFYDLKFMFTGFIVVLFFIIGAFTNSSNFNLYLKEYYTLRSLAEKEKNLENVKVIKKPNKFIFVCEGGESYLPRYLIVLPNFVDYPIEDVSLKPFVETFQNLDWSFIIGYLFSLLAFLITYDSVSGEKERGTLRLLASQPVSKHSFIHGCLLGYFLSLSPFLFLGLIVSLIILLLNPNISFESNDWVKIILCIFLSVLFISTMLSLGIFTSALSAKPSVSLIISLFIWVCLSIIIPNGSILVSEIIAPIPSFREFETELRNVEKIFESKVTISSLMLRDIYTREDLNETEKKDKVSQLQEKMHLEHMQALDRYKRDVLKIRNNYLKKLENQRRVANIISKLSPLSVFLNSLEGVAGTGYSHQKTFLKFAEQYMKEYTEYVERMQKELKDKAKIWGPKVSDEGYEIKGISWISYKDVKLEKGSFPKFPEYTLPISKTINYAIVDITILIFFNILFFLLTYVRLLLYDVR